MLNQGKISVIPGGVVALIAPTVTNEGTITAKGGSVFMGAGNQVSLDFEGDGLISYTIDKGAVDALAANKGLIKADGGLVVMTAKAADSLTQAVVNNSGVIEARTLRGKVVEFCFYPTWNMDKPSWAVLWMPPHPRAETADSSRHQAQA